jgi:hypothetical protein
MHTHRAHTPEAGEKVAGEEHLEKQSSEVERTPLELV